MLVKHQSGDRFIDVKSSSKAENIKRVVHGRYTALTRSIVNSEETKDIVLNEIIRNVEKEIKHLCSAQHNTILRDNHEAVKKFSWKTVYLELCQQMPILMKLLAALVNKSQTKAPLLCLITSMILKSRCSSVSLAQRAISVFLYGNGAPKQVH